MEYTVKRMLKGRQFSIWDGATITEDRLRGKHELKDKGPSRANAYAGRCVGYV
jgi:hypothetical protein